MVDDEADVCECNECRRFAARARQTTPGASPFMPAPTQLPLLAAEPSGQLAMRGGQEARGERVRGYLPRAS